MDVPEVVVDLYAATWALLPPTITVVALVAGTRLVTSRLFSRRVKRWVEAAIYSFMASVAMYVWGLWKLFAWDIGETCRLIYHEPWDRDYGEASLFPLEHKCNASFDMVPSYVNPAVVILLVAAVVLAGFAVRTAYKNRDA